MTRLGLVIGAVSGLAATVPMTVVMAVMQRSLPSRQQTSLPPERITIRLLRRTLPSRTRTDARRRPTVALLHLGFGTLNGAIYGISVARLPLPGSISGSAYSLVVWFASYQGWAPAFGLHPPASAEPAGRNLMMVCSHLVWGTCTGMLVSRAVRGARA